jgi:hypothetical protein
MGKPLGHWLPAADVTSGLAFLRQANRAFRGGI